jgi:hypothetical protein
MSWNTSVLLAEGKSRADMKRVIPYVFPVTKRTLGPRRTFTPSRPAGPP